MNVVFDTNVFISAFIVPGSQGERVFLLARQRFFDLHTSVAILTETAQTLREKFGQSEKDITAALKTISRAAKVWKPAIRLNVLQDIPDNRILECAVEARADVVVTGDRHLLHLKKFRGIAIVRLADFLRPGRDLWFWLDKQTGTETIYVLASEEPVSDMQALLRQMDSADDKRPAGHQAQFSSRRSGGVGGIVKGRTVTTPLSDSRRIQKVTEVVSGSGAVVRATSFHHR